MKEWNEYDINKIQDIPLAIEEPLVIHGKESGYKALVNDKTKDTISVVSDTYQLTQHKDVWEQASKYNDYKILSGKLYNNGRVLMIEINQKKENKQELVPGDYMESRVRIFNSYDGSRALTVQAYGIRLVCSNGMVAPTQIANFRKVHAYQNIQVPDIGKAIQLGMGFWQGNADIFRRAVKLTVNVEKTLKPLQTVLAKKYLKIVTENLQSKENLYAVWNELTRTVTHDMAPNINTDNLVYTQQQVNKVFKYLDRPQLVAP